MNLKEKISSDLKAALKAGEQFKTGVLRLLLAAIHNKEIELRSKNASLADDQVIQLLSSESKKRREVIPIYQKGNRADLAVQEEKELAIIEVYLPKQMSIEEARQAAMNIIGKSGAKNFNEAIKAVMKELKGKADARILTEFIKSQFNQ